MPIGVGKEIRIGSRVVGDRHPCFIIAEAGSNHNGNLEQAYRLIDVAAEAGADAVKFQNFRAEKLYPPTAGESDYLKREKGIFDIIREMEMPDGWVARLADYCGEKKIFFLSTPFDEESVDLIDPFVPAYKVASCEMTHYPLLSHMVSKKKPIIMSTACSTLEEVVDAVGFIRSLGHEDLILLQCTGKYPAPMEGLNLRSLPAMREATGCLVGLSDHSRDPLVGPVAAVALGACAVEKHFTLSNRLPGPDHGFALTPEGVAAMVKAIRQAEAALGDGRKIHNELEEEIRLFARRSVFTIRAIRKGERFTRENTAVLRNGKHPAGLHPRQYPHLLGSTAAYPLKAFEPIPPESVHKAG
ncbi:MAG: N-acetylneuraminate synthase family protein [Nitrospirae bacterium]|nr:N-acetylneuraminate synthase family protein [Nitrospirota bacterium]